MSQYGKLAEDEVVSRWEEDVDELQQEYWENEMARANQHHIPGYVWHITHRCHKSEFFLKFDKDKKVSK
jgi:hypothetical protein